MRTRVYDIPGRGYSFQYTEARHPNPLPSTWHHVGGDAEPTTWPSAYERDRARACFTKRRSVAAALADLQALNRLSPPSN